MLNFIPTLKPTKRFVALGTCFSRTWGKMLVLIQRIEAWNLESRDYLADLLHKMGKTLGYDFDFHMIKNNAYYPRVHGEAEEAFLAANKGWAEVLGGKRALKMEITNLHEPPPRLPRPTMEPPPPLR
jgi:hypothetical protein